MISPKSRISSCNKYITHFQQEIPSFSFPLSLSAFEAVALVFGLGKSFALES